MTANVRITQVLLKRGNTAAASNYTGPIGEVVIDTGLRTLRIQDGTTAGGHIIQGSSNVDLSSYATKTQLASNIATVNGNIVTANTAMKGYVDAQISSYTPNLSSYATVAQLSANVATLTANAAVQDSKITGANAAIVTANTALKAYTDTAISTAINNLINSAPGTLDTLGEIAANLASGTSAVGAITNSITSTNANVTAANVNIATLFANAASQSADIATLTANAAAQQTQIGALQANVGGFYTWANANFGTSSYSNANVTAYLIANPQGGNYSNVNVQAYIGANVGSFYTYANATYSTIANAATQAGQLTTLTANAASQATAIADLQTQVYSNVNAAAYLSGNVTTGNLTVSENAVVLGNLRVQGTQTTVNAATLTVDDLWITVANGAAQSSDANGAGLRVAGALANIAYSSVSDSFEFNKPITVANIKSASWEWTFNDQYATLDLASGGIRFADSSIQTTAWTGPPSNISNGLSSVDIPESDGNVIVDANGSIWNFDSVGNITFPDNTKFSGNTTILPNTQGFNWHFNDPMIGSDTVNLYMNGLTTGYDSWSLITGNGTNSWQFDSDAQELYLFNGGVNGGKLVFGTAANAGVGSSINDVALKSTNGNVFVTANSSPWVFDLHGNLRLPTHWDFMSSPAVQTTGIIFGDGKFQNTAYTGPGNVLINESHSVFLSNAGVVSVEDIAATGNLSVNGNVDIAGNITLYANAIVSHGNLSLEAAYNTSLDTWEAFRDQTYTEITGSGGDPDGWPWTTVSVTGHTVDYWISLLADAWYAQTHYPDAGELIFVPAISMSLKTEFNTVLQIIKSSYDAWQASLDTVTITSNNRSWAFGTDGNLTLPSRQTPFDTAGYIVNVKGIVGTTASSGANISGFSTVSAGTFSASRYLYANGVSILDGLSSGSSNTGLIRFDGVTTAGIYNANGGGITISNFSYQTDEAETAFIRIPDGNSSDALIIQQEQGTVEIRANTQTWEFGTNGRLYLPSTGSIEFSDGTIQTTAYTGGSGNVSLPGLSTSGTGTSNIAGSLVYTLGINTESESSDEIQLKVYAGGDDAYPAISIGQDIGGTHRANVVAIGNNDVGYNSLPGGVYIGYGAGFNDTEQPQGLYSIAIGSKAAWDFATNNSITLNATGNELNPDESGLFIKPIREEQYDDAILYYNAQSGEVTYATNTGGGASIGNTAPASVNGRLWYNTDDGRTYVYALDTWIDASPSVVPGNMVGYDTDGNITLRDDASINYANGVSIINSVYGDAEVAEFLDAYTGNIAKIGSDPLSLFAANIELSSDNETWRFASTGNIIFPDGTEQATAYTGGGGVGSSYGNVELAAFLTDYEGNIYINSESSGLIIDAAGDKRVGFMKYFGMESSFVHANGATKAIPFQIGRVAADDITQANISVFTSEVYIAANGKVGINTTGPTEQLDVNGVIRARGAIYARPGSSYGVYFTETGSSQGSITTDVDAVMQVSTSGGMVVNASGNRRLVANLSATVLSGGNDLIIESNTTSGTKTWTFDADGNLAVPGNINFANGVNILSTVSTNTGNITFDGSEIITPDSSITLRVPNNTPTGVANWEGGGGWNQGFYGNLATTGGTGTGLTVDVAAGGGGYINIEAISIHTPGTGYTDGDVITINNENNIPGTFTITVPTNDWAFGANGALTTPGSVIMAPGGRFITNGNTGTTASHWYNYPNTDHNWFARFYSDEGANLKARLGLENLSNITIETTGDVDGLGNAGPDYKWSFGGDGSTTFPDHQPVTITGNLTVGNLTVTGNTTTINTQSYTVVDNIIQMATDNPADTLDLGFVAHRTIDSTLQHTGFIRDASINRWVLFSNVTTQPTTTVDLTQAMLDDLQMGNITASGFYNQDGSAYAGTYSDSNVSAYLSSQEISSANIGGSQLYANTRIGTLEANIGSFYTYANATYTGGGGSTYSNANVASYLPTYSGNISAANIVTTGATSGNISGANYISANVFQVSTGIFWANGTAWSSSGGGTTYSSTGAGNVTIAGSAINLTASGPGATTVGSSTAIPVVTTDAYGRVSTMTTAAVVAPAGTLTGTTLASGVVTSSLTTVGTLGSLAVTGNITAGNIIANQYGNSIGTFASYTGNVTAQNIITTGTYGNITNANVISANNVVVSGFGVTMANRPAFRIYGGSPTWFNTSNVNLKGTSIVVDYNQGNYFNSTTGIFTAPVAGLYQVTLNARVGSNNGQNQIVVGKNGVATAGNVAVMWESDTNTGTAIHYGVVSTIRLAANDWLSANITVGNIQFDQNDSWTVTYIG